MSELSPLQFTRAQRGRWTGGAQETFFGMTWKSIVTHWSLGAVLSLSCAWVRSQCQGDYLTHKHGLSNDPFLMTSKLWLSGHPGGLRKEGVQPQRLLTHKERSLLGCHSARWGERHFGHHFPGFLLNPEDQEKQRRWKITSIYNYVKSLLITTSHTVLVCFHHTGSSDFVGTQPWPCGQSRVLTHAWVLLKLSLTLWGLEWITHFLQSSWKQY